MISDVLFHALENIEEYLTEPDSNYDRADPALAKCLVAMWECLLHFDTPPIEGLDQTDFGKKVVLWKQLNADQLAKGLVPISLLEYKDMVGGFEPIH